MRLLFVTYRFPAYTHDAACNTVYHLVKHFAQRHEVSLAALAPTREHAEQRDLVAPYCQRIETVVLPRWRAGLQVVTQGLISRDPLQMQAYWSPELAHRIRRIIAEERIDLAYGYHLRSGQYLTSLTEIPRCVAIQPAQILHFGRRMQHIRHPLWRLAYAAEHARLRGYELALAKRFEACLLISETDRQAIDPGGALTNVYYNPHGVDTEYFAPNPGVTKEPETLVFTGALSIDTNSDAVLYFCRSILPLIKREVPGVKLYVVGKGPPAEVRALAADPSIIVTGYVDDVRPFLWRAEVGIDPLRIGAGMQNKVLEGMASGLPMVNTTVANEGIGATHSQETWLADAPEDFARAVITLLRDPDRRERIGRAARDLVAQQWSWEAYFAPLEELFEALVRARPRSGQTG